MATIKIPLPTYEQQNAPHFDYEIVDSNMVVMYERNGKVYAKNSGAGLTKKVYLSIDDGASFSEIYEHTTLPTVLAHVTETGSLIVFFGNAGATQEVFRSTDDTIFTSVLTGVYACWETTGIDSDGLRVMFGEYGGTLPVSTVLNIYRSEDDGATWASVKTETVGTDGFDHFHSCQAVGNARWIATTGDSEIRWWYSTLNGDSWNETISTTDQRFRTLSVVQTQSNNFKTKWFWASDGAVGNEGIYYIELENPNFSQKVYFPELIMELSNTSYGLVGAGNILVSTTNYTGTNDNRFVSVITSLDGGETWQYGKTYKLNDDGNIGGITKVTNIIGDGKVYLHLKNVKADTGAIGLISAKLTLGNNRPTVKRQENIGRSSAMELFPRALYTVANTDMLLSPPRWARGLIVVARTYTLTGTGTPTLNLQTNHYFTIANTRGPYLESTVTVDNKTVTHYMGLGFSKGEALDRIDDVKVSSLPLMDRILVTFNVSGATFGGGEGIDAEAQIIWIP